MAEFKEHQAGSFCWVDLATTDAEGAKKFYSELMGWNMADMPAGEGMVYTMLMIGEKVVAALYGMGPEQRAQGLPPHWMSYVTVSNVDEMAEKAKSLGGTAIMEPADVFDYGRMANIQDPTGAILALWQPKQHIGAQVKNEVGTVCWNELMTNDEQKAAEFYSELFGWTTKAQQMGDGSTYTMFNLGDTQAGGMMKIQEQWGDVPPNWMVYFAVDNCNASEAKVASLGGKIIVPTTAIPDVGKFAVIQDPQGAVSGIVEMKKSE